MVRPSLSRSLSHRGLLSRGLLFLVFLVLAGSEACGTQRAAREPRSVLTQYAQAIESGDAERAYALLSTEARRSLPFEAFARMVAENRDEMVALGRALLRPASEPVVTATVTTREGQALLLVYQNGQWRIDGSALDLYSQKTPEEAVRSFLRAYRNRRYDVLLRFVPASEAEDLDEQKLRQAWEGEQKAEMERLTQALQAGLATARCERLGRRATISYGAGGTVELVEEAGSWKIEDLR